MALAVTPISNEILRVHSLPPMAFPKEVWYKTSIYFDEKNGVKGVPVDIIVIR